MKLGTNISRFLFIPLVFAILLATAWSVYSSSKSNSVPKKQAETKISAAPKADDFFQKLYNERLKEEGNRTERTEKLIRDGKLSSEPARFVKEKSTP